MADETARGAELGRELSAAVVMFHEAVGAHLGVSASDQRALSLIGRHGPVSAGELAERTGLTPGAITGMIGRLERAGLVRKDTDPADGRRVLVVSTGAASQPKAFRELAAAMADVVARYSEAEQRVIADYVVRTTEVLRQQTRQLTKKARS